MSIIKTAALSVFAIFLASLGTIASFGIVLSFLWFFVSDAIIYKIVTSIISAYVAIILGGFILAWISKRNDHVLPAIFGLLFGIFSFSYFLGVNGITFLFTVLTIILAVVGSSLFQLIIRSKSKHNTNFG